jgi:hypothetical protein
MLLWPDIVVGKPDSSEVLLAVEVKAGTVGATGAEAPLKAYMAQQSCPVGMFVTAEETLFFRNPFIGYQPETIQEIGRCRTTELLKTIPGKAISESVLVRVVEQWLENLATRGDQSWPPTVREAIESCVVPAVMGGVVRTTGRRLRRTGS